MAYTKQNFTNGQTLTAEQLSLMEDGIIAADSHIKYVESKDTKNLVNLRDLESGSYVLNGKFRPYSGSSASVSFSSDLIVNVITKATGTHVQVFYPVNNCVQFLSITDDSYERTNVYLNDLKEKAEIQPDLNAAEGEDGHILNRTHYTDEHITNILPELTWTDEDGWIYEDDKGFTLFVGNNYIVRWNGVAYHCVAKRVVSDGTPYIYLGNDNYWDLEDSGEPFFVMSDLAFALDNTTSGTLSVDYDTSVVHKLDNKYIDAEWMATKKITEVDVIQETECNFTNYKVTLENVNSSEIKNGEVYTVYWNGEKYIAYAMVNESEYDGTEYIIGNGALLTNLYGTSNLPDTGEPFLFYASILTANKFIAVKSTDATETITLKVVREDAKYNTIPTEFLPEGANSPVVYTTIDEETEQLGITLAELQTMNDTGKQVRFIMGSVEFNVQPYSTDTFYAYAITFETGTLVALQIKFDVNGNVIEYKQYGQTLTELLT